MIAQDLKARPLKANYIFISFIDFEFKNNLSPSRSNKLYANNVRVFECAEAARKQTWYASIIDAASN